MSADRGTDWIAKDAFFLTTDEVAKTLRVVPRTVQKMIERRELGAVRVGSDYRIPRPALDAYIERQTTTPETRQHLPTIARPSTQELKERLSAFEKKFGSSTKQFLSHYGADPEDPRWGREHHQWAALAEALNATAVPY